MSTFFGDGLGYVIEHAMNYGTVSVALTSILILCLALSWGRSGGSIRHVPGPPSPSWMFGNMRQLLIPSTYGEYEFRWQKLYGPVYRLKGCFGQDRLMVSDPVSLQFILNSSHFTFGPILEDILYLSFGQKSIMMSNGSYHKRLRAALNVGFTAAAVRDKLPVLEKVAQTLEDISEAPIDICPLLSIATLCTISEVAFGYTADDLEKNTCREIFRVLVSSTQSSFQILAEAISAHLPKSVRRAVIHLPTQTFKIIRAINRATDALGKRIVREKTDAARQGLDIDTDVYGQLLEHGRSEKHALTEEEIAAQTAALLIAGQDTTANTLAFALLELARAPDLQEKLRAEIHSMAGSRAYDSMPLLNAVIKETLRTYPIVPLAERIAVQDTVIPLADHITTSTGERMSQIHVCKGQIVSIDVMAYNQQESRWGEDPREFNPSRWLNGMTIQGEALGPHANLLSFMGGPRACLGLSEMQVFICEVVGKFSLTLPGGHSVRPRYVTTLMPTMPDGTKGAPLCVKRIV
ncbi:cytochrome P450, partial [Mycena leptocephala]